MSFVSTSRGLWLFDRTLSDEIQNNDFIIASGTAEFQPFQRYDLVTDTTQTKYGLIFRDGVGFVSSQPGLIQLSSAGQFSFAMSFWWYSPGPVGYTRHDRTRQTTSKVAPLVAIADTTIDTEGNVEKTVSSTAEILAYEVAASDTTNAIRYEVCSTNYKPTHRYESDGYAPGLHHIFISHHTANSASVIKIFVDGRISKEFAGPSVNITTPAGSYIKLNSSYHGPLEHKTYQDGGYISELAIRGGGLGLYSNDPGRVFKFGWEGLLDEDISGYQYDYFGVGYEQPTTVTTNQIYSEGGRIYVARSNGDILRGESPVWDNEFNYVNDSNIKNINIQNRDQAVRTNNGLKLTGTTARI